MKNKQIIYGIHTLLHQLKQGPQQVIELYVAKSKADIDLACKTAAFKKAEACAKKEGAWQEIVALAFAHNVAVHSVSKNKLDEWSVGAVHQGVAAAIKVAAPLQEEGLLALIKQQPEPLLLVLDEVQDPHNLGAILRTADAANVAAIIVPKDHSVNITPVVRKAASGAADLVPFVRVTNLARTLQTLQEQGVWIVGMDCAAGAKSIFSTDLTGAKAIVLGAEGKGLRQLTRKHCDYLAMIPMFGKIESLNVSVAAGVCLFEAVRQRRKL